MYTEIRFTLNGEQKLYQGDLLRRLLDVLREDYGLTGSRKAAARASAEPAPSSKTASWSRAASSPSARSTAASF